MATMKPRKTKSTRAQYAAPGTRPIRSDYYKIAATRRRSLPIKTTKSRWALKAVPNAVMHMQLNTYDAEVCEVYDEKSGELHAQIRRNINGDITITYMRGCVAGM